MSNHKNCKNMQFLFSSSLPFGKGRTKEGFSWCTRCSLIQFLMNILFSASCSLFWKPRAGTGNKFHFLFAFTKKAAFSKRL